MRYRSGAGAWAISLSGRDSITGRYLDFARQHGIEMAGVEFIETADGRLVTYDINTTTNYNAGIEAVASRPSSSNRGSPWRSTACPTAGCAAG
jgi:hypothetical protein